MRATDRREMGHSRDRMTTTNFMLLHRNEFIIDFDANGNVKMIPLGKFWLSHPQRRSFKNGVVFDPTTTESRCGFLNLWRGFAFKPVAGSWEKLKTHIRVVICKNNREYFDYLMGWMARAVQ